MKDVLPIYVRKVATGVVAFSKYKVIFWSGGGFIIYQRGDRSMIRRREWENSGDTANNGVTICKNYIENVSPMCWLHRKLFKPIPESELCKKPPLTFSARSTCILREVCPRNVKKLKSPRRRRGGMVVQAQFFQTI